jgi:hypothetical protein
VVVVMVSKGRWVEAKGRREGEGRGGEGGGWTPWRARRAAGQQGRARESRARESRARESRARESRAFFVEEAVGNFRLLRGGAEGRGGRAGREGREGRVRCARYRRTPVLYLRPDCTCSPISAVSPPLLRRSGGEVR